MSNQSKSDRSKDRAFAVHVGSFVFAMASLGAALGGTPGAGVVSGALFLIAGFAALKGKRSMIAMRGLRNVEDAARREGDRDAARGANAGCAALMLFLLGGTVLAMAIHTL